MYDHGESAEASEGGQRSLAPSDYFIRLAAQVVAALTAPGAAGRAFEVDMRLRPSGNKGPLAVRLPAFRRYHAEESWTWERMALTRARAVAGPPALRRAVAAAIDGALAAPRDPAKALADARDMRARRLRDHPPEGPWDLKHMAGGLVEVEFVAQALAVAGAAGGALDPPRGATRELLAKLAGAGLLGADEAAALAEADRMWRHLTGLLRLTAGRAGAGGALPAGAVAALARAVPPRLRGAGDEAALRAAVASVAGGVQALYAARIAAPRGSRAPG